MIAQCNAALKKKGYPLYFFQHNELADNALSGRIIPFSNGFNDLHFFSYDMAQ